MVMHPVELNELSIYNNQHNNLINYIKTYRAPGRVFGQSDVDASCLIKEAGQCSNNSPLLDLSFVVCRLDV